MCCNGADRTITSGQCSAPVLSAHAPAAQARQTEQEDGTDKTDGKADDRRDPEDQIWTILTIVDSDAATQHTGQELSDMLAVVVSVGGGGR